MTAPLLFYFDFTSPYSYLAGEKIDALAARHGRAVTWRPILLGAIFKAIGSVPLVEQPGMAGYCVHDFARSARFMGLPYAHPAVFPIGTVNAARAFYWLAAQDEARARRFAQEVFRAYFVDGQDIADLDVLRALTRKVDADATLLAEGLGSAAVKDRLRAETDAAVRAGAFGAPWIVVDNESFWGADRLPQIEHWLANQGF